MRRIFEETTMENLISEIEAEISQWKASQKGQTSGYEYEMSFITLWQRLGKHVFQQSVGTLPKRAHEKKTSNQTGRNYNAQKPRAL
jgi:hypothetical protein